MIIIYMNSEEDITKIYPYCYKIKNGCPPCNTKKVQTSCTDDNCLQELSKYLLKSEHSFKNGSRKEKHREDETFAFEKLKQCLQQYGDIYYKLDLHPYVNPKTEQILFPEQGQIQAKFNEFIRSLFYQNNKENLYKIKLFNILLNSKLREIYNSLYNQPSFANPKSLKPKDYGIGAIIKKSKQVTNADEQDISGGKIKKRTKRVKTRKPKKTRKSRKGKRLYTFLYFKR